MALEPAFAGRFLDGAHPRALALGYIPAPAFGGLSCAGYTADNRHNLQPRLTYHALPTYP